MTAAIERSLHLIVPTAPSLPLNLIDLASSLLAQSRAKVPKLKQDEEIARTYACCHLACERLKHKANLEIGKIAPPCGPRVYKKLYSFLDSALPATPSTPKRKRTQDVGSGEKVTPLSVRTKLASTTTTTPVQRSVGSVLGKRSSRGISKVQISLQHDTEKLSEPLDPMEDVQMADEDEEAGGNDHDDEGNTTVRPKRLPAKTPLRRKEKHARRAMLDEDDAGAAGLLPGLGTMFQPAVDWLSEERQAEYVEWKADMLDRLAALDARG